jgi:hypothetical protein
MFHILGHGVMGAQTMSLLTKAWATSTSATHGISIQRYSEFCEEQQLVHLHDGNPATMARFVTCLGNLGTIKASSL